ncbi:MAG TPA: L,D-transpeptidase [Acidimicrobiia bacterium]|nr:L,D-transpeptidase [Acidimicrobiia bacterium]
MAMVVALAACSSGHATARDGGPSSVAVTTSTRPARAPATTLPAYLSLAAQAIVPHLSVFDTPGAPAPARVLDNPWLLVPHQPGSTVPQVFLVETRRTDGWVRVLLPIRPNGSSGWVRARDVTLSPIAFRIRIELSAHRITVFDRGAANYTGPIADGAPATPTPVGHYYIRVLIKAPNPNTVYGPYAYGLSSHSDTLTSFDGGDAETGIHGNNDASVLGTSITHGCIRIDNTEITRLANLLPLGTPVDINP